MTSRGVFTVRCRPPVAAHHRSAASKTPVKPPGAGCGVRWPTKTLRHLVSPIADIGSPFNSTDAVTDPSLPFRRLIRAGHLGDDWFVWYEHGGIVYFWEAVIARVPGDGAEVTTLANVGTISDTLCSVTDGVYAGLVPPYPDGAWAAGGY